MKRSAINILNKFLLAIFILQVSCAIVTINVYFPAEEVKDAFKALEQELLDNPEGESNPDDQPATDVIEPVKRNQLSNKFKSSPDVTQTRIITTKTVIKLVPEVLAQGDLTNKILNSVKNDPAVIKSYENRNGRLSEINKLLSKRIVGEGNNGLLVPRGSVSGSDSDLINAENADRKTIVDVMAKKITEINKLEPTPQNVDKFKPLAAEQFAAVRREEVPAGSLIQMPDGQWRAK
jgi:hypothetical protein